jgi:hypothetical protein
MVFSLLFPFNGSPFLVRRIGKLRHEEVRLVDSLALALKAGLLSLVTEKVFSTLHTNIIVWKRSTKRSPGTFEVGEIDEGFFEEDGPFDADELQEDCLEKFFVNVY